MTVWTQSGCELFDRTVLIKVNPIGDLGIYLFEWNRDVADLRPFCIDGWECQCETLMEYWLDVALWLNWRQAWVTRMAIKVVA
jgi:hypothetical protein